MRSNESLADATQIEMREIDRKEAYDRRGDRKWSWGLTRIASDKEGMGGGGGKGLGVKSVEIKTIGPTPMMDHFFSLLVEDFSLLFTGLCIKLK